MIIYMKGSPEGKEHQYIHLRLRDAIGGVGRMSWAQSDPENIVALDDAAFASFKPTVLELVEPPCFASELYKLTNSSDFITESGCFLSEVKHLRIYWADLKPVELLWILNQAESLESIEYSDLAHVHVYDRVVDILVNKRQIKYFDVAFQWPYRQVETLLCELRDLRALRFSGPAVDEFLFRAQKTMQKVELVYLLTNPNDFPFRFHDNFFQLLARAFPSLQFLLFDWHEMRTPGAAEWSKWTKSDEQFVASLLDFHKNQQLNMTVINVITPTQETRKSAKQLYDYVRHALPPKSATMIRYSGINPRTRGTRCQHMLIMICSPALPEASAQALREKIMNTFKEHCYPDLRLLAYFLEDRQWHFPRFTVEFSGLDEDRIQSFLPDNPNRRSVKCFRPDQVESTEEQIEAYLHKALALTPAKEKEALTLSPGEEKGAWTENSGKAKDVLALNSEEVNEVQPENRGKEKKQNDNPGKQKEVMVLSPGKEKVD